MSDSDYSSMYFCCAMVFEFMFRYTYLDNPFGRFEIPLTGGLQM